MNTSATGQKGLLSAEPLEASTFFGGGGSVLE